MAISDTGLGLCEALGGFWVSQGYLTEGEEWVSRFIALAEATAPDMLAPILHVAGRLAEYHGQLTPPGHPRTKPVRRADAGSPHRRLAGVLRAGATWR